MSKQDNVLIFFTSQHSLQDSFNIGSEAWGLVLARFNWFQEKA